VPVSGDPPPQGDAEGSIQDETAEAIGRTRAKISSGF
jgi:hypothetical protein